MRAAVGCGGGPSVVVVVGWGAGDETGGAGELEMRQVVEPQIERCVHSGRQGPRCWARL